KTQQDTSFIHKVSVHDTEWAMIAIQKEIKHFLFHLYAYTIEALQIKNFRFEPEGWKASHDFKTPEERYDYLKDVHGDIQQYYVQLQTNVTDQEQTALLDQYVSALRNGMYGAKSLKDALFDAKQLS